eukprot:2802760-Heterocapsa_arctica.AAC.1
MASPFEWSLLDLQWHWYWACWSYQPAPLPPRTAWQNVQPTDAQRSARQRNPGVAAAADAGLRAQVEVLSGAELHDVSQRQWSAGR